MMLYVGKLFKCTKTSEVFELVETDDGDFMHDGCDKFIEVKESDYDDGIYYNPAVNTQFFYPIEEEGEEA